MGLLEFTGSLQADSLKDTSYFRQALDRAIEKTRLNLERFQGQFPYYGEGNRYRLTDNRTWVTGYWTAWLWMAYYETGDSKFKDAAEQHYEGYNRRFNKKAIHCHDIGVIYDMAAVRGYAVTGDPKWKNLAIRAAASLATRFREKGQFLQAWLIPYINDEHGGRTIIDSLCCTPLWYWAAETLGDAYYRELGVSQTNMLLRTVVRDDYSSGHSFLFDPETEEPLRIQTWQGYADHSTWSRGQAWGIQGLPVAYAYTGEQKFLDAGLKMLDWYVDKLSDNIIPPWDFDVPEEERDTSSLALAVNGMLRLAGMKTVPEHIREACMSFSRHAMEALIERHGTMNDPEAWGLLREGVYNKPGKVGIKEFMIWGDYYFLENLMILAGNNPLELELYHPLGR